MIKGVEYGSINGVEYGPIRGVEYDPVNDVTSDKPTIQEAEIEEQEIPKAEILKAVVPAKEVKRKASLNFDLKLLRRVLFIRDTEEGEEEKLSYRIQVNVHCLNGKVLHFEGVSEGDRMKNYTWLNKVTHSLATLPSDKTQKAAFQRKVQEALEDESAPTEIIYRNAGWRNIRGLGWRYVYEKGYVGGTDMFVHADAESELYALNFKQEILGSKEVFLQALSMGEICKNGRVSTEIFLYFHASLLTELFSQAGAPLCFVFALLGVTNSRKTSLVTAMAKLFDRKHLEADTEFTSTACGIEKVLSRYKDGVVIVDDLKPGINRTQQTQQNLKMDQIARFYGNRIGKKRMTEFSAGGDKIYFPISGGCIITMELVDAVLSSLSRIFLAEIDTNEVQNDKLSFYQSNRWILPTHAYDFLAWITQYFDYTVAYIQKTFRQERCKYIFAFPRHAEMFATMITTAKIIGIYACNRGFLNAAERDSWVTMCEGYLVEELNEMVQKCRNSDKGILVMAAFAEALRKGQIEPVPLNAQTCSARHELYEDESRYFIQTRVLRSLTNGYARKYDENQYINNESELIGVLEKLQVIEILEKNGKKERSRKLPMQMGNSQGYVYLVKKKLSGFENF